VLLLSAAMCRARAGGYSRLCQRVRYDQGPVVIDVIRLDVRLIRYRGLRRPGNGIEPHHPDKKRINCLLNSLGRDQRVHAVTYLLNEIFLEVLIGVQAQDVLDRRVVKLRVNLNFRADRAIEADVQVQNQ